MSHLVEENDGYRYRLTVIDEFSKHAWVKKLKKKDGKSVTDALDEIFGTRKPVELQTNKGKEFLNATFQKRLRYGNSILRQSKRKHQSKLRRTFQPNFQDKNVEVFYP